LIHFLYRLQQKYKGIPDLMRYIVIGNVIVYLLGYLGVRTVSLLCLNPEKVFGGQVWRLISFIFLLPVGNILFAAFVFYFYYIVGRALENQLGSFIFTLYYACNIILTIIISLMSGISVVSAAQIHLSLFLAFGYLFPEYTIFLFMIIPVKMKYLAIFYGIYTVYEAIMLPGWGSKLIALVGLFTFLMFFYGELLTSFKERSSVLKNRQQFHQKRNTAHEHLQIVRHQCEVCKRTELDDPNLEFRYCSGCDGYHEYCIEHLGNHVHIKSETKE